MVNPAASCPQEPVAPRLLVPYAVCFTGCLESASLLEHALAFAAGLLYGAEEPGSEGHLVYYTLQHLPSGRRSTGRLVIPQFLKPFGSLIQPVMVNEQIQSQWFRLQDQEAIPRKLEADGHCTLQIGEPVLTPAASLIQAGNHSEAMNRFIGQKVLLEVRRSPHLRNPWPSPATQKAIPETTPTLPPPASAPAAP
jgi:hypothetical protein